MTTIVLEKVTEKGKIEKIDTSTFRYDTGEIIENINLALDRIDEVEEKVNELIDAINSLSGLQPKRNENN